MSRKLGREHKSRLSLWKALGAIARHTVFGSLTSKTPQHGKAVDSRLLEITQHLLGLLDPCMLFICDTLPKYI